MEYDQPGQEQTRLPTELAQHVPAERIAENEARLLSSVPEADPAQLEAVKHVLLELPLVHSTDSEAIERTGLLPQKLRPEDARSNTFSFDTSLGLDSSVFFDWPKPPESDRIMLDSRAENKVLVSADLLLDSRCYVTPRDLLESAQVNEDEQGHPELDATDEEMQMRERIYEWVYDGSFEDIDAALSDQGFSFDDVSHADATRLVARVKAQIENLYFSQLVSGATWLEYTARKIIAEGTADLQPAEVKFNGVVPASSVVALSSKQEFEETYEPHLQDVLDSLAAA